MCKGHIKPEIDDAILPAGSIKQTPEGGRNLKSGITAKPDESGIKCVVQFAHEKLNPVHVKTRVFKELPFHFLVAGEVELLLQEAMSSTERVARLHFLRMLCYHREYLDIVDLRDQYDTTLKNIERGSHTWSDFKELEGEMHSSLTFTATVNARQGEVVRVDKSESKKEVKKPDQFKESVSPKIIYCSDFNKKNCPFEDHHQGIFNKKQVTKWHICSKCIALENSPKRSHPAMDCKTA